MPAVQGVRKHRVTRWGVGADEPVGRPRLPDEVRGASAAFGSEAAGEPRGPLRPRFLSETHPLLLASRVARGPLPGPPTTFGPAELCRHLAFLHGRRAASQGTVLAIREPDALPTALAADLDPFLETVDGALDGALAHRDEAGAPPSAVRLSMRAGSVQDGQLSLTLTIEVASGSPLPPGSEPLPSGVSRYRDVLAGLTRLSFATRASVAARPERRWPAPPIPAHTPVAIVDDERVSQLMLRRILEGEGCEVRVSADGPSAVDSLLRGPPVSLILLDMQLPGFDGPEVARRLRAAGIRTPILGVTANAFAADHAQCLEAGMNGVLTKPVGRRRLVDAAARWIGVA